MFGNQGSESFLGLPECSDLGKINGGVALLGIPCATPYESVGTYCAGAPAAIRRAVEAYPAKDGAMNFDFGAPLFPANGAMAVDCGDLTVDPADSKGNRALISAGIGQILDAGAVPVVLGGDDSVPIPMFDAFAGRGQYTLVQIDAHIDWRDEVEGERRGLSSTMRRASEMEHIGRIIQVGQRGAGSARQEDWMAALDYGVEFVSGQDIYRYGIDPVLDLVAPGSDVLVAFDCDALDPAIMPGVIMRTPGGMDYWQVVGLLQGIAAKARIAGFDLVEFVPARDVDGLGALTAAQILANAMGLILRQQTVR